MATHSTVLAWRIPGTGEPGGLPSMGSHRVGHDLRELATAAAEQILKKKKKRERERETERDKRGRGRDPSQEGSLKRGFQTPENTLTGGSVGNLGISEGNISRGKNK